MRWWWGCVCGVPCPPWRWVLGWRACLGGGRSAAGEGFCDPLWGRVVGRWGSGGVAPWGARPPAMIWHPSGMARDVRRRLRRTPGVKGWRGEFGGGGGGGTRWGVWVRLWGAVTALAVGGGVARLPWRWATGAGRRPLRPPLGSDGGGWGSGGVAPWGARPPAMIWHPSGMARDVRRQLRRIPGVKGWRGVSSDN